MDRPTDLSIPGLPAVDVDQVVGEAAGHVGGEMIGGIFSSLST